MKFKTKHTHEEEDYRFYLVDTEKDLEKINVSKAEIVDFLFLHLGKYNDDKEFILKALEYVLGKEKFLSGIIGLILNENNAVVGAAVVNNTNMEGYIPENILVYIALDKEYRKKGLGKKLLDLMINKSEGDIALHVDFDNKRARKVYKKMGFKEAYIEMRYKK